MMKLIAFAISFCFFLVPTQTFAADKKVAHATARPEFVEQMIVQQRQYDSRNEFGFAAHYAWGTGRSVNGTFTWFAWTNSDALFQIATSIPLSREEMRKIEKIRDRQGRNYSAQADYISTSNDWLDDALKYESAVSKGAIVGRYMKKLGSVLKEMKVREYL